MEYPGLPRRAAGWLARQVRLRIFPREKRHSLVGQPHLWKMKRSFQIAFLQDVGMKPEHYLLDIGCGTLRGGIPMIRYLNEGHYFGIDTRSKALTEARKELSTAGLNSKNPVLVCASPSSAVDLGRTFDYVWAFSVLLHMTDDILDDCLAFVRRHLAQDGVFYANVNVGARLSGAWKGFPVVWRTFESYQQNLGRHGFALEDIGPLRAFGHVTGLQEQDDQRVFKMMVAGTS
jgi:SAM-dependent methyltransferase